MNTQVSNVPLTVLGITLAVTILVIFVAQPFWSLLDCAVAQEHAKETKIRWLLLILFTGIISGFFYGLRVTKSRLLRAATIYSAIVMALSLAILIGITLFGPQRTPNPTVKKGNRARNNAAGIANYTPQEQPCYAHESQDFSPSRGGICFAYPAPTVALRRN